MSGATDEQNPAALELRELHVVYRLGRARHDLEAVRGVDLRVHRGELLAVVGESGSGKSTLANAVLGLLPGGGRIDAGQVLLGTEDITHWSERQRRTVRGSRVALVPQDPMVSLNPVRTVGDQVADTIRLHTGDDRRTAARRVVELLREVGLPDPERLAGQYPHQLSGGMRQRVLLANAWANEPEIVIADEPTSALDTTVQRQVLDRLDRLREQRGTAVLLITHDLGVALERADRILVLRRGRVVETGRPQGLLARPQHDYTRTLLRAAPGLSGPRLLPGVGVPEAPAAAAAEPVLEAHGLHKVYRAGRQRIVAVDGVDLVLQRGRTHALVGESGSGKSTTARMMARLATPSSGRVVFRGAEITAVTGAQLRSFRRRLQFVHQSPYASLNPRLPIRRIISEPLRVFRLGTAAERASTVERLAEQVALPAELLDRRPDDLSGGQRQRVAIARALALRPEVLVLDEPVSALDAATRSQILQLLVDLRHQYALTYLFITHDLAIVRQFADEVSVMQQGRIVEHGETAQLFAEPQHPYTRALLDAVPGPPGRTAAPSSAPGPHRPTPERNP